MTQPPTLAAPPPTPLHFSSSDDVMHSNKRELGVASHQIHRRRDKLGTRRRRRKAGNEVLAARGAEGGAISSHEGGSDGN